MGAGVDGDSVPGLDLLTPDRGVILLFRGVDTCSVLPGDLALTKGSLRDDITGDGEGEPCNLGVNGLLTFRKFELRAGVSGLEELALVCLSAGIVGRGDADGEGLCCYDSLDINAMGVCLLPEGYHRRTVERGAFVEENRVLSSGVVHMQRLNEVGSSTHCLRSHGWLDPNW